MGDECETDLVDSDGFVSTSCGLVLRVQRITYVHLTEETSQEQKIKQWPDLKPKMHNAI